MDKAQAFAMIGFCQKCGGAHFEEMFTGCCLQQRFLNASSLCNLKAHCTSKDLYLNASRLVMSASTAYNSN